MTEEPDAAPDGRGGALRRELGLGGAVLLGLGSILGTGIFVSLGVAAGVAGNRLPLALLLGVVLAACNGLSSAQLAAVHPVSGGSYAYGYRFLTPWLGFTAGWTFLLAKGASAATAALGFAGYLLVAVDGAAVWRVPLALTAVAALTGLVLTGVRRSNRVNAAVVGITLLALAAFVLAGLPQALAGAGGIAAAAAAAETGAVRETGLAALLHATALMFVAYTGYGRVATLGEEVREPRRTFPRAVVVTLAVTLAVSLAVAVVALAAAGAPALAAATEGRAAPLELLARGFGVPGVAASVALGAITAMLGVLLNLILGLSRVLLAMGREGDAPARFARVDRGITPTPAVLAVGVGIAGLALLGDVRTTWTFSAFAVLVYYAVANAAALAVPDALGRFVPRWVSWLGLVGCLGLALFIPWRVFAVGLVLIGIGWVWHRVRRAGRV